MKKYKKPIVREIILDSELDILDGSLPIEKETGGEEYSKGNTGWEDDWEED